MTTSTVVGSSNMHGALSQAQVLISQMYTDTRYFYVATLIACSYSYFMYFKCCIFSQNVQH